MGFLILGDPAQTKSDAVVILTIVPYMAMPLLAIILGFVWAE